MPQSFAAAYMHVVFSTKNRVPMIDAEIADRLYPYCGGILRDHKCTLLQAGGIADHIHLLVSLSREMSLSELVRLVKSNSSAWVRREFPARKSFAWQAGYGAFSVSHSQLDVVREYIVQQARHHQRQTFQDEFRKLLQSHGLTWDENYVWG